MGNKRIYSVLFILIILAVAGCSNPDNSNVTGNANRMDSSIKEKSSTVEKIEVFHFHGTHQCYSCKTVGAYAEETVNTYFSDDERVEFRSINGELPENKKVVMKYGATGSSLWFGVYDGNGFHAEQNIKVWYKINNKEDFMSYLKNVIENNLKGESE